MKPEPYRLQMENYPFSIELQTRFSDLDPLAHVNNVAIMRLFEESRVRFASFSREASFGELRSQMRVVAKDIRFSFLREVSYPETVIVAAGIKHVGNTSYQVGCAMFQGCLCVALSDAVLVSSDGQRSQPIPQSIKAALQQHAINGADLSN